MKNTILNHSYSSRILSLKSVKTRFNLYHQDSIYLIENAGKNVNLISQQVNQPADQKIYGLVVIT